MSRTINELKEVLDAMPRPLNLTIAVQMISVDPETGQLLNAESYTMALTREESAYLLGYYGTLPAGDQF